MLVWGVVMLTWVQYLVQVVLAHKDYSHASPSGGVVGEVPVWVVAGSRGERAVTGQRRLVGRSIVGVSRDTKRMACVRGSE